MGCLAPWSGRDARVRAGDSMLFRVKDGGLVHLWHLKWLNTETVVLQKEQDPLMLLLSWAASVWGSSVSLLELGNQ